MEMKKFIDLHEKLDIFEKAVFYLGGVKELEGGYQLKILPQKHYVRSIGRYHIVIEDAEEREVGDLGYVQTNKELVDKLRAFYGNTIKTIILI